MSPGRLTGEGTLLGTFQYMAPEQLEGKEADRRTDIFAFGTLLFEMATGRKAFEGDEPGEPDGVHPDDQSPVLSSSRSGSHTDAVPVALDHLVERCLAKNPDERWQTARDLKLELEWVATGGVRTITARRPTRRRYVRALVLRCRDGGSGRRRDVWLQPISSAATSDDPIHDRASAWCGHRARRDGHAACDFSRRETDRVRRDDSGRRSPVGAITRLTHPTTACRWSRVAVLVARQPVRRFLRTW